MSDHSVGPDERVTGGRLTVTVGLALTAVSFSSGLIWASRGQIPLVYLAGVATWVGYIVAHYGETGVFVDHVPGPSVGNDAEQESSPAGGTSNDGTVALLRGLLPDEDRRAAGFLFGNVILVVGIAVLAWYVRQEAFLLAPLGSGLFLVGYAVAHYFDSENGHLL